jgi:hypothetical protein
MPSSSSNVDRIVGTVVASRQLRGDRASRRLPRGDRVAAADKSSHERIEMPERGATVPIAPPVLSSVA